MDCYKNSDNCQMCCILFISSVHMMHCGRSMMPRSYRLLRRQDCVFSQTSGPHCCMETLITSHTCNPSLTRFVVNNYYKPSNMTISLGAIHQSPFPWGKFFMYLQLSNSDCHLVWSASFRFKCPNLIIFINFAIS